MNTRDNPADLERDIGDLMKAFPPRAGQVTAAGAGVTLERITIGLVHIRHLLTQLVVFKAAGTRRWQCRPFWQRSGRGAELFSPVEVIEIETGRSGIIAMTKGGPTIRCETIVYATG